MHRMPLHVAVLMMCCIGVSADVDRNNGQDSSKNKEDAQLKAQPTRSPEALALRLRRLRLRLRKKKSTFYPEVVGFPEISHEKTAKNIFNAQRNAAKQKRPIIHLCALFGLRFEAPYLLPWIAHHALYGVDHVHLYMDDVSSAWSEDLLEVHSDLLRLLDNNDRVTLYSLKKHKIVGQEGQLEHCVVNTVNLADWVGNWDIDETIVSQKYGAAGSGGHHRRDILKHVLHKLPATALGVSLPRNEMGPGPTSRHKSPEFYHLPFHEDMLECEQYVFTPPPPPFQTLPIPVFLPFISKKKMQPMLARHAPSPSNIIFLYHLTARAGTLRDSEQTPRAKTCGGQARMFSQSQSEAIP